MQALRSLQSPSSRDLEKELLRREVAELREQHTGYCNTTQTKLKELEAAIQSKDQRIVGMAESISGLNRFAAERQAEIGTLHAKLKTQGETAAADILRLGDQHKLELDRIKLKAESSLNELKRIFGEEKAKQQEKIERLQKEFAECRASQEDDIQTKNRLDAVTKRLAELAESNRGLQGENLGLHRQLTEAEQRESALKKQVSESRKQVARLEESQRKFTSILTAQGENLAPHVDTPKRKPRTDGKSQVMRQYSSFHMYDRGATNNIELRGAKTRSRQRTARRGTTTRQADHCDSWDRYGS